MVDDALNAVPLRMLFLVLPVENNEEEEEEQQDAVIDVAKCNAAVKMEDVVKRKWKMRRDVVKYEEITLLFSLSSSSVV